MPSDTTSFSLLVNSKLNKSCEVKFMIAVSINLETPLQNLNTSFQSSPPPKKVLAKLLKCVCTPSL